MKLKRYDGTLNGNTDHDEEFNHREADPAYRREAEARDRMNAIWSQPLRGTMGGGNRQPNTKGRGSYR